jgi:hypothetical protein
MRFYFRHGQQHTRTAAWYPKRSDTQRAMLVCHASLVCLQQQ